MKQKSGFTLIELSVVLALIGVMLYGSMSILITSVQTTQVNQTVATMDAIEKALLDYRVAFNRLPCPTDLTATITNANYAVEAANMGSCTGGSPAANFIAATGAAEGGVPVRALRLPDSFMVDGWGHRFRYAVNPTYTVASVSSPTASAAITVNDASGAARSTTAIYAIVSHGANGHGGYTSTGIVANAKSTNADEQTNCHCDNTGAHTGGAGVLSPVTYVQKAPTIVTAGSPLTSFDDIVTYKEGWQMMTPNLATNDFVPAPTYYRTVTIDHTKVGTVGNTDQINFPVLISGTYAYLASVANGGTVTNANGYDITFTSDAAGHTLLPFERESYNATTGAVTFWVQVPTVSHSADTVIYLQYANSAITTDQSNATGTWDSNFKAVWHLDAATGASQADSTTDANTETPTASPTQAAGQIGGSLTFNGTSQYLSTSSTPTGLNFEHTNPWTQSLWLKPASTTIGNPLTHYATANCTGYAIVANSKNSGSSAAGYVAAYLSGTGSGQLVVYSTNVTNLNNGSWNLYEFTYDGSNTPAGIKIYENGVALATSTSANNSTGSMLENTPYYMATSSDNLPYNGQIDEVRVSNVVRSADWIKTEYNSEIAPDKATYGASGFYTIGAQTSR